MKLQDIEPINLSLKWTGVRKRNYTNKIFDRNVPGITEILLKKTIGIAGLGGLGSNVAITLARCGIGKLILGDFDRVELSNINRQHYFLDDVGERKTDAIARYLKMVNPDLVLEMFFKKLSPKNIPEIFKEADLLIEAFDKAEDKSWLIEIWSEYFPGKPVVCASGLGGYGNTESLKVERSGCIFICGDGKSHMNMGLSASRVAIVANMQANVAIEILVNREKNNK